MTSKISGTLQRTLNRMALVTGVVFLSCSDSEPPAAGLSPTAPNMDVTVQPIVVADDWDHFSADQQFIVDGPMTGLDRPDLYLTRWHHIDRTLAGQNWTTVTDFQRFEPFGTVPPHRVQSQIVRIRSVDDGSSPRFFNSNGVEISTPFADPTGDLTSGRTKAEVMPAGADTIPAWPSVSPGTGSVVASKLPSYARLPNTTLLSQSEDLRAWLDEIVVTRQARTRALAQLARKFGSQGAAFGRLRRYTETRGDLVTEYLVDRDVGAIVELNAARRGKLQIHVTKAYGRMSDGSGYLLTGTRTQIGSEHGGIPTTIELRLANVKVSKRGGSQ